MYVYIIFSDAAGSVLNRKPNRNVKNRIDFFLNLGSYRFSVFTFFLNFCFCFLLFL